ncbi:MAG: transcriptional regulator [Robiginitomaculum sp.]|nr:MAG: transcriptional regulator [Robiginitomaculum sp.]
MTKTNDRYELLADCSCNMLRKTARKITQFYEHALRDVGIKPTQFTILAALANKGPMQLTMLADKLLLERTGLTRNLNVLVRNGWVSIEAGETDLRQRVITLTDDGFEKLDAAYPYWHKAQISVERKMGQSKISELRSNLQELTDITAI